MTIEVLTFALCGGVVVCGGGVVCAWCVCSSVQPRGWRGGVCGGVW